MNFVNVVPSNVDAYWPQISAEVEESCVVTGGDITAHYLWSQCRNGQAFLILVMEDESIVAHSTWRFEEWTTGRKLRCLHLYGARMKEWAEQAEGVTRDLARIGGATGIVTEGRMGFQRLYPQAKILRQLYEVKV